ncbi:unnamed protein product [Trichobilharzia regenti]|nr:unnamed protein product [Trichobilharzia regenti]
MFFTNIVSLWKALIETNPWLLVITVVVSIVHSVFELLAFKNDIQFWKTRESLEGLSVRSVFFNVFQSFIVVLYVLDNDTNFVIKLSVVLGLLIEVWKIKKVLSIKVIGDGGPIKVVATYSWFYNIRFTFSAGDIICYRLLEQERQKLPCGSRNLSKFAFRKCRG